MNIKGKGKDKKRKWCERVNYRYCMFCCIYSLLMLRWCDTWKWHRLD